jgi:hypothetical protein
MEVKFDAEWKRLMDTSELAFHASEQGLRRAGAQALAEVNENFKRRGRPQRWNGLTPEYRKRKKSGKVVPGGQLSSTAQGRADLVLTGALLRASVMRPRHRLTRTYLDLWPNPTVRMGRSAVGVYADFVNGGTSKMHKREYYSVPMSAERNLAIEYEIGFMNVLHGVPDPVGRQFG